MVVKTAILLLVKIDSQVNEMTKIVVNGALKDFAEKIASKINRREFPRWVRTVSDLLDCLRTAGFLINNSRQLLSSDSIIDDIIGNVRLMHAHVSIAEKLQPQLAQIYVYPVIHIHYPGRVNYQIALQNTHLSSFAVALDVFELQKGNTDFGSVVKRLEECSIPYRVREIDYEKEWGTSDKNPADVYGRLMVGIIAHEFDGRVEVNSLMHVS